MSLPALTQPLQPRCRGVGLWPALLLLSLPAAAAPPLKDQPHLRRPIAAAWIEPGKLLAVANQRSGTVSLVDTTAGEVRDEVLIGQHLSDLVAIPQRSLWLATDDRRHELIVLVRDADSLRVTDRLPLSPHPVDIEVAPSGARILVASLWSRKVTVLRSEAAVGLKPAHVKTLAAIEVPFNPRQQAYVMDPLRRYALVADAFAGNLAVLDTHEFKVIACHEIEGHGIELASSTTLRHHVLHSDVPTRPRDIERGLLIHPATTRLDKADLLDSTGLFFPSKVEWDVHLDRKWTAAGPGVQPLSDYVLDRFADSVIVRGTTTRLGPSPEPNAADRGEALFFDTRLSAGQVSDAELIPPFRVGPHRKGGWISCHSCHTNGHTCGQLADTLGDGTLGTPKRIPTLLGTRLTDMWAWNGEVRELHEQVRKSLDNTMHAPKYSLQDVLDITAFLHTLPPPPPLEPATEEPADKVQLARGAGLFKRLGCAKCHVPPLTYTSPETYDVGLEDEKGLRKFNPPSLRGVSQGYSFFHDSRAKKLEEVFTVHGHQLDGPLEQAELADLLRFLRSL